MLIGLLNGQSIEAFNQEYTKEQKKKFASENLILCPICNGIYEYCHGQVNHPYFRHKERTKCDDLYSEPETNEHIIGKQLLFEWIKAQNEVSDVKLEGYIEGTKQRPDIMFKYNDKQYVLEYQCSPISSEYYERHNLYRNVGVRDFWICGTENYFSTKDKKRRLKTIGKESKIYFNPNTKTFSFHKDVLSFFNYKSNLKINGARLFDIPMEDIVFKNGDIERG